MKSKEGTTHHPYSNGDVCYWTALLSKFGMPMILLLDLAEKDSRSAWWDCLEEIGLLYGYFLNSSLTRIITKPEHAESAREVFHGTGITISVESICIEHMILKKAFNRPKCRPKCALCLYRLYIIKSIFKNLDAENMLQAPKRSSLYQIIDQQPLRQMTETALGLQFAFEVSIENIASLNIHVTHFRL